MNPRAVTVVAIVGLAIGLIVRLCNAFLHRLPSGLYEAAMALPAVCLLVFFAALYSKQKRGSR